jgi:hypothetical protein
MLRRRVRKLIAQSVVSTARHPEVGGIAARRSPPELGLPCRPGDPSGRLWSQRDPVRGVHGASVCEARSRNRACVPGGGRRSNPTPSGPRPARSPASSRPVGTSATTCGIGNACCRMQRLVVPLNQVGAEREAQGRPAVGVIRRPGCSSRSPAPQRPCSNPEMRTGVCGSVRGN